MKKLFCVKIQETDKTIPVENIGEAVRVAAYHNSDFAELYNTLRDDDVELTFAIPMEWPGGKEDHKRALEESTDWRHW